MFKISCPLPGSIPVIPSFACPFKFDQIVRVFFQRRQSTDPFTAAADIQTLTRWAALLAATDATKIVASPIFVAPTLPRSEALTTGGNDNTTFNGIPEYNGEGAVTFTAQLKNVPPVVYRTMKQYSQESISSGIGISNLTVYLINNTGAIFCINPVDGSGAATTNYKGIPIYNFRISSPGSDGFNAPNINDISFSLPADWADYLVQITPAFDPLTMTN